MPGSSRASRKVLLIASFIWVAALQQIAEAQKTSITTSSSISPSPSPSPSLNMCRMFNGALNPCGLKPDQFYYFSEENSEEDFLQYMAIVNTLTLVTDDNTADCGRRLAEFACLYLYPRCSDMMPMAPCQNYCKCILQESCGEQWTLIAGTIEEVLGNYTSEFTILIANISARGRDCKNLDFYGDEVSYAPMCDGSPECTSSPSSTLISPPPSSKPPDALAIILGSVGGFVLLLVFFICLVFICCILQRKNRKVSESFFARNEAADYLKSGDSSILRLARVNKRKSKFRSPRELLKQVPPLYSELMVHNSEYLIQESRIHTTSFLAEGTFSEVYLGNIIDLQPYDTSTFRSVVVKHFKDGTSDAEVVRYLEMCLALGSVSHPNVMSIIGISFNAIGSFSMIYPYLEEHDLLTHLRKQRSNIAAKTELQEFSVDILAQVVFQICQGMRAISRMHIVYKTLCAHACMVHIDEKHRRVVIGDASFSKLRDFSKKEYRCTSPHSRWLAPESILEGEFTEKSDVWSFGITCWEVFTFGSQPFADMDYPATPAQKKLSQPPCCPDSLFAIVQSCWSKNEKERPSFADLMVRLDTLLARRSYQQEVTEINTNIQSGTQPLVSSASPLLTNSNIENQYIFDPTSKKSPHHNLEDSLKTTEGYLKVIADQSHATTESYQSFSSSDKPRSVSHPPAVNFNDDEDPDGYVECTPDIPPRTSAFYDETTNASHKPGTHIHGDSDNIHTVVSPTPTNAVNQSEVKKTLMQEDTEMSSRLSIDKAKKPAPLPKPAQLSKAAQSLKPTPLTLSTNSKSLSTASRTDDFHTRSTSPLLSPHNK